MKYLKWLIIVVVLMVSGCAKQLPTNKKNYIGLWKNNDTSILITASGRLKYKSNAGSVEKSISAPITEFTNRKITVGIWFLTTDFVISREPEESHGIWSVVIDGKELFKADKLGRLPQAKIVPKLRKIREMVTADLQRLGVGIKSDDFKDFIGHAGLEFQSQFTNEKMKQSYAPFVNKHIDLKNFMVGKFILISEPSISPDGVLAIDGRYPTKPVSLKFKIKYVYAYPAWKLIGVDLHIGDSKT